MPRYNSRSPSRIRSSSRSRRSSTSTTTQHRRWRSRSPARSEDRKDVLKTSLVFLGVIGAASLAASKLWPKGILYGEKESWAQEAKKEVKHVIGKDKPKDRGDRRRSQSDGDGDGDGDGGMSPRRQRPSSVRTPDEIPAVRPGHRSTYVDTGRTRQYNDADGGRSRRSR